MTINVFNILGNLECIGLGPYEVKTVTDGGSVQLKDLAGTKLKGNDQWESIETV
jgi:hypothetical protein